MQKNMYCPLMHQMQCGMPSMQYGTMPMQWGMEPMYYDMHEEDERDEEYFREMHPESCKRIMPYIERELDRMEGEESPLYDEYVDSKMLERMSDKIYEKVTSEMPEMGEEKEERQFGRRRFGRDIVGILLLQNLLRRRRRRRSRRHDYDFDYGDYDYYY